MTTTARRLRRLTGAGGVGLMALALLAIPAPSLARHGGTAGVTRAGTCTAASTSELKVKPDDGRLEVEFEVDQNRNNRTWHVVLKHDADVFFSGNRTTAAPSGSFTVRKFTPNRPGTDTIRARAVNQATGEVCTATASI